jgi:hypothetical protein
MRFSNRVNNMFRKKKTVVVATKQAGEVVPALNGHKKIEIKEALTTGGVYDALECAALLIVNVDDLVETSLNRQGLLDALDKASTRVLLPNEFLQDPEGQLDKIQNPKGVRRLTPLRVGFVSLSGGVGCSTLAYDLARRAMTHHEATVALIELTWGDGALGARLDLDGAPDLYQVVQDMRPPAQHQGVTVVPIKQRTVRLLLGDRAKVTSALDALAQEHVLVIVDAHGAHPLWATAQKALDKHLVVTDQRPDAVRNAQLILGESDGRGLLVLNKATVQDRVALKLSGQMACAIPDGAEDTGQRLIQALYS